MAVRRKHKSIDTEKKVMCQKNRSQKKSFGVTTHPKRMACTPENHLPKMKWGGLSTLKTDRRILRTSLYLMLKLNHIDVKTIQ